MDGAGKLEPIAFTVSLITIICLAVSLSTLFALYALYKSRHVKHGHEDQKIAKALVHEDKEAVEAYRSLTPIKSHVGKEIVYQDELLVTYRLGGIDLTDAKRRHYFAKAEKRRADKRKRRRRAASVLSAVFFLLFAGALSVAIAFRSMGETLPIGNVSYYAIRTGSMEKKNESNSYLEFLDDQIEQYSLVGIEKVEEGDVALYDILAYRHEGTVIVHRLINISTRGEGTYYTLRGDANASSLDYEIALEWKDIIGRYNGFQNYGLGVTSIYLSSNIGLVAIAAAALFVLASSISEDAVDSSYEKRRRYVADQLDDSYSKGVLRK